MKQQRSNISAALAIAVERQVDEIIAVAKARCALRSALAADCASARALWKQEIGRDQETARLRGLRLGEISGQPNCGEPRDGLAAAPAASYLEALGVKMFILPLSLLRWRRA